MERRSFVQGAFGLVVLVAGGGLAACSAAPGVELSADFVTPEVAATSSAKGPVMVAGIKLVRTGENEVHGYYGDTHLFSVDAQGEELVRMADGTRTIDDLAASLSLPADPADVASFFVTLGQAGYLQNVVLVNLVENPA